MKSSLGKLLALFITIAAITLEKGQSSPLTLTTDQAFVISTSTALPVASSTDLDIDMGINAPLASTENSSEEISQPSTVQSGKAVTKSNLKPEIYSFKIHSDITYRYARTYVTSRVVNANPTNSQEVTFRVVLPETAFISKFIMEIDGIPYEAYVKEKEEAKRVYIHAQNQGQSAGLVELNTRNANVFDVNVNIKSQSKVNFNLTYEELLSRRLGRYEQSISVTPDQITNVKDFQISVNIEESQNITVLRVPNLRNDVDAPADSEGNNQDAVIERPAGNKVKITWRPSERDQSQLAKQSVTGKFIVQYDIKRELDAGEVLVMNGYFVHFFAPENLPSLRKHVVFVLDTSGSMWGRRMEQLKDAMNEILANLTPEDFFNILTFSSDVVLWSPQDKISSGSWSPPPFHGERVVTTVEDPRRRQPYPATKENVEKAQKFIQSLVASGGTNIHDSIVQALNLTGAIKKNRDQNAPNVGENDGTTVQPDNSRSLSSSLNVLPQHVESLLMFLTDGEATVGVTNPTTIVSLIQEANKNISVPIFALGFGSGTDFPLIRKIALQNNGFARKIYEASDAALQLKGFYKEIASPLLSNVKFNYTTPESAYSVENVTVTRFPTVFRGTEIAVAGRLVPKPLLEPEEIEDSTLSVTTVAGDKVVANTDSQVDTLLTPTTQHYFDVEIEGSGRDGEVVFLKPEVLSCIIPWDGRIVRPFPPRPTPVPTQEDVFLERLWAYLTIQQLIEKDLAQDSKANEVEQDDLATVGQNVSPTISSPQPTIVPVQSNVSASNVSIMPSPSRNQTLTPETPKQKALRLALKYGFVTSLTSLVVVKPNSSDVTNAVAADSNPDSPDSLASPQSLNSVASHKVAFVTGGAFATSGHSNYAGPIPLSLSQPSFSAYPGIKGPSLHAFQNRPIMATATRLPAPQPSMTVDDVDYDLDSQVYTSSRPSAIDINPTPTITLSLSKTTALSTTPVVIVEDSTTTEKLSVDKFSLKDLTWYNESSIKIETNGTEYIIVKDDDVHVKNPTNCTVVGETQSGQCVHLKDCVQPVFFDDFDLYSRSYFCAIQTSVPLAAGVCCVKTTGEVF